MANRQGSKNTRQQAIAEAQKQEWPGITDIFRGDEIAWLANYVKREQQFVARPYPCVHGRLRLVHEEHQDGDLSITSKYEFFGEAAKAVVVTAVVVTKKGTFTGHKAGKLDDDGDVTLEKIETGAVGRALFFAGFGAGAPSAEEASLWIGNQEKNGKVDPEEESNPGDKESNPGDADPSLADLKRQYKEQTAELNAFANAGMQKEWQKRHIGKASVQHWTVADTQKALKLIEWRQAVGAAKADDLLDSLERAKAPEYKGLVAAFLAKMQVTRVTEIADLSAWQMLLETCASELGVTFAVSDDDIPF